MIQSIYLYIILLISGFSYTSSLRNNQSTLPYILALENRSRSRQPTNPQVLQSTRGISQPSSATTGNSLNAVIAMAMQNGSEDTQRNLAAISMLSNGTALKDPLVVAAVVNNNNDALKNYLAYQMAVTATKSSSSDSMMELALLSGNSDIIKSQMKASLLSGNNGQANPVITEGYMLDGDAKDFANASLMNQIVQNSSGTSLNPGVTALLMEGNVAAALAYQNSISRSNASTRTNPVFLQSARINTQPMVGRSQNSNLINPMTMYAMDGDMKDLAMINMLENQQGGNTNSMMLPEMMMLDGDFKDLAMMEMMTGNNNGYNNNGYNNRGAGIPRIMLQNSRQMTNYPTVQGMGTTGTGTAGTIGTTGNTGTIGTGNSLNYSTNIPPGISSSSNTGTVGTNALNYSTNPQGLGTIGNPGMTGTVGTIGSNSLNYPTNMQTVGTPGNMGMNALVAMQMADSVSDAMKPMIYQSMMNPTAGGGNPANMALMMNGDAKDFAMASMMTPTAGGANNYNQINSLALMMDGEPKDFTMASQMMAQQQAMAQGRRLLSEDEYIMSRHNFPRKQ